MRQILVDHARRKHAHKRGGRIAVLPLDEVAGAAASEPPSLDVLALNEALGELGTFDARLSKVVEIKFFGGLSIAETAEALGVSTATVERDWMVARAWLHQRLSS
jgi:RNA polymerase sigma factor (TIGR02999 family)